MIILNEEENSPNMQDFESILESISDGVFTVDSKWNITSFNRAAEDITGVSREDALGRPCSEVLRSSLCGSQCALRKTLKDGHPIINKKCYFIDQEGEQVPISLSTAVFRNGEGQVIGGAETFRDLSDLEYARKQLNLSSFSEEVLASRSPAMKEVFRILKMVSVTDSTVLILGETGTGKELTARTIHDLSDRREEPFLAVNCAALPETLLESLLFGHMKGAFTGAVEDKPGFFTRTGGGTLFLDEIGDISPALQVRLLRVLQEQEYEPVGGTKTVKSQARILAATHRDLKAQIRNGEFREDLYYRLNVVSLELPPLRNRTEDIPALVEHFIQRFNSRHNRDILDVTGDTLSLLMQYSWPGNIRELENVIERACILCSGNHILPECLTGEIYSSGNATADGSQEQGDLLKYSREEAEIRRIRSALRETENNKLAAAELLGIHKTTLFRKLKKYHIQ